MDSAFFIISKLFWILVCPGNILVILLLLCLIFLLVKSYKKATGLFSALMLIVLIITLFPVGQWLLYPIETRFQAVGSPPKKIDGIIVLAGAENLLLSKAWQQIELNDAAERMLAFIHLTKKFPNVKHVFTGGSGSLFYQQYSAATVAKKLFKQQGLNISKIIFEKNSRNTYESAKLTHAMVKPKPNEKWLLITSASHMPRSVGVFTKFGWQVIPYAVDHQTNPRNLLKITFNFSGNLRQLTFAVREWIGLCAYYITGKTSAFFPKPTGEDYAFRSNTDSTDDE